MKEEFLRRTPIFATLDDEELSQVLLIGRVVDFEPDRAIFAEGDAGAAFYLVEKGAVRISKMTPLGEEALAILREGAFFGEMALLDDTPRSAHAFPHEGSARLIEFRIRELRELMEKDTALACKMLWALCRTLAARLRDTNDRFQSLFIMTSSFQ
ncbi:MAG: cyclic nucleotide-binding domain-containing protein [Acidobacteria bacterium]|nr:cyclic nucleotide-binding domain-containing protein [Acidobacteriota bacterium]